MSRNITYIRNVAQIVLDQLSLLNLSNTTDCREFTQIINSICIFANPDPKAFEVSSVLPYFNEDSTFSTKLNIKQFRAISNSIDSALDTIEQIICTSKNLAHSTPQFLIAVGQIRASVELRFKNL